MNENLDDNGRESPKVLPLLGIMLGTLVFIAAFVLLLYTLYVWLGPWIATFLLVDLVAASFYAAYRLFWRGQDQAEEPPTEDETDHR